MARQTLLKSLGALIFIAASWGAITYFKSRPHATARAPINLSRVSLADPHYAITDADIERLRVKHLLTDKQIELLNSLATRN